MATLKKVDLSTIGKANCATRLVLRKGKRTVFESDAPFDEKKASSKKDYWKKPCPSSHQEVLIPYVDKNGMKRAALHRVRKSNLEVVPAL